ncbi:MAG: ATP-grasp domain-containing protein [Rhodospirillales bacterium]|nr:ATP-grasp domain-containing protein [Rhodospirillales bacterium]
MFSAILVANRGEIACRIMRTARRLGVRTVAVYSDADADAMHVAMADEAYRLGPAEAGASYLCVDAVLKAASAAGAEAIHPGYGFLSENAAFADAVREAGLTFIGPPADAIRAMGSKSAAKAIMEAAGVPVVPGYHGSDQSPAVLAEAAAEIGFPVLIKAVAGGGGKGMRIVDAADAFPDAVGSARREARAAFGDDHVLIEKYLKRPRHVEMQVFADRHGSVVHLFERDCSVQRRHQKIIEEAPAPGVDARLRARLGEAAVAAARAIGYEGAGTIEFLLSQGGDFYFMEMNTRLQVEHPVTEFITGVDLVEWQLRVAAGEPLPDAASTLAISGHAFEARLYAEDPDRDFLPATGVLRHLRFPEESQHVRIDTGVREGDEIAIHYDPLIAKLIAWDTDRTRALSRLRTALAGVQVVGTTTNVGFLSAVAAHPAFAAGDIHTGFIDQHRSQLLPEAAPVTARFLALASLHVLLGRDREVRTQAARSRDPYSPWHSTAGWRLNDDNYHVLTFRDGERAIDVTVHYRSAAILLEMPGEAAPISASGEVDADGNLFADLDGVRMRATIVRLGNDLTILCGGASHRLSLDDPALRSSLQEAAAGGLMAPMPGKVIAVNAAPGDAVARGATLIVLEAMKMEHAITAPADGTIAEIRYRVGEQVEEGAELVTFVEEAAGEAADATDIEDIPVWAP